MACEATGACIPGIATRTDPHVGALYAQGLHVLRGLAVSDRIEPPFKSRWWLLALALALGIGLWAWELL